MKKILETIGIASGIVMLFGIAMTVGSIAYEAGWVFAIVTAIAIMVFCFAATAEWFYDRGNKDATEEENE